MIIGHSWLHYLLAARTQNGPIFRDPSSRCYLHLQQIRVSCGVGGGLGAGTAGAFSGWCCTASSVPLQTMHDFGVVLPGLNLCLCQGIRLLIRIVPRAWVLSHRYRRCVEQFHAVRQTIRRLKDDARDT
jgi:hypothetical protein